MYIVNEGKTYRTDSTFTYSCQYHAIFCTKYKRPVLRNSVGKRARELILEKQVEYSYNVLELEIMSDHVHMLLDVNPRVGIYNIVTKIKGYTSNTLRKEFPELRSRLPTLWTRSKFISSVGTVSLEAVKKYLEDQKSK